MNKTADGMELTRDERRALWHAHVEAQRHSGQSVKAYCAQHGLKAWQWFYWRKALAPPPSAAGGFVEVAAVVAGTILIECGGCRMEVRPGFDAALLRQVVATLRAP